ncbi:MAG: alpha/beta fold hydrolase [Nitriliruptoraceae bacterium]
MLRWLLLRVYRIPPTPTNPTPADLELSAEDVELAAVDGTALRGWFLPAAPSGGAPGPAVVVLHGWGSAASDLLPAAPGLVAAGLSVLLIDVRGHGRSDPADFMSMPRFAEDLEVAVARLRADPRVDPDRIGVIGHSVGAGACLLAASRDPRLGAVVAIAAMAHPAELIRSSRGLRSAPTSLASRVLTTIEDTIGHRFDAFAPINTIGRIVAPVVVLHGDDDTTVPPRDAARLADAAGGTARLRLVPGAGHRALAPFLPLVPELATFLQGALTDPGRPPVTAAERTSVVD